MDFYAFPARRLPSVPMSFSVIFLAGFWLPFSLFSVLVIVFLPCLVWRFIRAVSKGFFASSIVLFGNSFLSMLDIFASFFEKPWLASWESIFSRAC